LLRDKRRKRDVLSTLNQLPKGSVALDDAYNKATKQIDEQLPGDCLLAKRAISWITYAQRPLTTNELCHAVSIEHGDKALDSDDIYNVEGVISVCAGLVAVDEESNVIRLVHSTTQEYFERELLKWNPGAQEEIAIACLTYLSFDTFRSGSCASDEAFEQRLVKHAFFNYSARYWSKHVRPVQNRISHLVLGFLYDKALVDSTAQGALTPKYKFKGYSRRFPNRTSGLHLAARYGLLHLIEGMLRGGKHGKGNIVDILKDDYGRTPLSLAAEEGHEAIVRLLVERDDVEGDSKDKDDRTPLWWAAARGHAGVVRLLLESKKVNVDSKDLDGRTPLSWAMQHMHEAVVRLLLRSGMIDIDSTDPILGLTPLSWAAKFGYEAVVRLLLESKRVDVNSMSSGGRSPMSWAAEWGHEAVVRLLIESGQADLNLKDSIYSRTPLFWAITGGHEVLVRLLLGTGQADVNSKDFSGRTPLFWAITREYGAVVKLLLGNSMTDVDLKDSTFSQTPLSWAAEHGCEVMVQLLVRSKKADIDSIDMHGRTPLSWAAEHGHETVVRLLLESGKADVNLKDSNYDRSPLFWAVENGHEAVVRLLLEQDDIRAELKDSGGHTPLWWAVDRRHDGIVTLLKAKLGKGHVG